MTQFNPQQLKVLETLKNETKFFLGVEVGAAKTILAIETWFKETTSDLIVVAPKSTWTESPGSTGWIVKMQKYNPNIEVVVFDGDNIAKQIEDRFFKMVDNPNPKLKRKVFAPYLRHPNKRRVFIFSYESMITFKEHLIVKDKETGLFKSKYPKDTFFLVIDEAHRCKDSRSERGKAARYLSQHIERVILMSGTPISKDPYDLLNYIWILDIKDPTTADFNSFELEYVVRYNKAPKFAGKFGKPLIKEFKNYDKLLEILQRKTLLATQKEMGIDVPEHTIKWVKLPKIAEYKGIFKGYNRSETFKSWYAKNSGVAFMGARSAASGYLNGENGIELLSSNPKIEWLEKALLTGNKFILFYNFDFERDTIKKLCDKLKVNYGEVSGEKIEYDATKNQIILLQYQAGSLGIDGLQHHYRYMINYSPTTNGSDYIQSIGRLVRGEQKQNVIVFNLIVDGTIEKMIYESLLEKENYTIKMFRKDQNE